MRQRPMRWLRQPAPRTLQLEVLEDRWNRSAVLLSEDFESTAVRTLPLSLDTALGVTGPDAWAEVTGPGGRYPLPFGPAGNRSLVIDNPGGAQPVLAWSSEFPPDAAQFQSGTISFDLLLAEPGNRAWTFLDVRMGYGGPTRSAPTTVGDTTIWNSFRINASTPDVVLDQGPGGGSAAVSSVTRLRVVYDIHGPQQTYRLTINGAPVVFDRGAIDRPWIAGAPGINMIAFVGATPQTSGLVFIDNLVVTQTDSTPPGWSPPADEPTNRLEWHQHRGNQRLTGEAQVSENVVAGASTVWSAFVGARESWFSLTPIPQQEAVVQHPPQNIGSQAALQQAWDLGGPYWDLAGNGQSQAVATSPLLRIGDFIPGNGVLEKLEGEVFDTTFGQGVVRLFVYHQGNWVQQWQSPTLPAMFSIPNLITGDFDHDGQLEVALTPWNDLYLLNMQTGQIEQSVRFKPAANESGRPYGWLGAYDMDGDQRSEFVLMGDFQDFITVIGWDSQGRLTKLWERVFDGRLSNKRTTHRPGLLPVMQVQGDNALEITTSVYNETGDLRWHTLVLDGRTGAPRADFADRVVDGLVDYDQDGRGELFLRTTTGSLLAESSTLEIVDWQSGQWQTRWSQPDSRFVQQAINDFPAHVNSATSTGKRGLLRGRPQLQGPEVFFTQTLVDASRNISAVTAWGLDAVETAQSLAVWQGPALQALAIRTTVLGIDSILVSSTQVGSTARLPGDYDANGRVDARDFTVWQDQRGQSALPPVSGADGSGADGNGDGLVDDHDYEIWKQGFGSFSPFHVLLQGATARAVFSQTSAPPRTSAVVGRMAGPDAPPTVLIPGGGQTVVALTPNSEGQMRPSWSTSGWGAFFGATQNQGQHNQSGLALADVDGNETLEALYATRSETGRARLVAARADGSPLWHADFDVPGGLRIFNEPGLVAWRTGHFTSTNYADVLVQLMYGIGGTGEFVLLDGRDGSVRWRRNYGNTPGSSTIQRGAGEAHLAI